MLTRLAADSGARRGELAALQLGDLDGAVLTIARSASGEVVGLTKSGLVRRLTLTATTVDLRHDSIATWLVRNGQACEPRRFGPWLFSTELDHTGLIRAGTLGHWFHTLCHDVDMPAITLHRLRHAVATALGPAPRLHRRPASPRARRRLHHAADLRPRGPPR